MRTEVWKIDPARAAELLATVTRNRPVSSRVVDRYARVMTAGRWRLTGASMSVVLNGDGVPHMINGSHRMQAVIKSGVTQEFLVVFEEDEDVFRTFDVGRTRSTSTLLGLRGQTNAAVVGAISRAILMYTLAPEILWASNQAQVDQDLILMWHEEQGEAGQETLNEVARFYSEVHHHVPTVGAWYGALIWLIRENSKQPELLLEFHEAVRYGANLPVGDPRLAFRNWVVNNRMSRGGAGDNSRQAALAIGIKAWNDWLAGEQRFNYKFQPGRFVNGRRVQSSLPMPKVR